MNCYGLLLNHMEIWALWWNKIGICSCYSYISTHMDSKKMFVKKCSIGTTQGCYMLFSTISGSNTLQNNCCIAAYLPSHKSKLDEDMLGTATEVKMNSYAILCYECLHMDETAYGQPTRTNIHQLCEDTGCHLEDISILMDCEIFKGISTVSKP